MVLAIVIAVLAAIVVSVMLIYSTADGQRSKSRGDRAQAVLVVDRALSTYEYALESNLTDVSKGFRLNKAAMDRLAANDSVSTPVANSSITIKDAGGAPPRLGATWMPNAYAWSMQTDLGNGVTGWWQLYEVIPIGTDGNANVVAYIRTWTSAGGRLVAEPRTIRAEIRPGLFSDFQILVDGPIPLNSDAIINGRIHTNGYDDAYIVDMFVHRDRPIKLGDASGSPTCHKGAAFSTAEGTIEGSCTMVGGAPPFSKVVNVNTNVRYDLLRGRSTFDLFDSMCGGATRCVGPNPGQVHDITLSGSTVTVKVGGVTQTSFSATSVHGLLVRGNASITGTLTSGGLTVAVRDPGGSNAFGSASLRLTGNGTIGATAADSVLGLVVDGDIIPSIDTGSCPKRLEAAVLSTSGTLTVPGQYRSVVSPGGGAPFCNTTFTLHGSLAAHYAPFMYLGWSDGSQVGYAKRRYDFDPNLLRNPPPMFPTTGPWQVTGWKDAMAACLGSARHADPNCG